MLVKHSCGDTNVPFKMHPQTTIMNCGTERKSEATSHLTDSPSFSDDTRVIVILIAKLLQLPFCRSMLYL
jgi:hypothetical protein